LKICVEIDRGGGNEEKRTSKFGIIYEIRVPILFLQGGPKVSRPALIIVHDFYQPISVFVLAKCLTHHILLD
jgi:hypothetical protein